MDLERILPKKSPIEHEASRNSKYFSKKTSLTLEFILIRGCGSKGGGGLKFVKVVQFWKIIAHWIALTELYVLGALKSCDLNVHIF